MAEELTVTVHDIAFGGDGVARHDGRVVFVPYAAEGETVRVRVRQAKKQFLRAELVEVVTPSPHRVEARCPLFTRCGGCQYQHLAYAEQARLKETQVRTALQRIGKVAEPPVLPLLPSPEPYGYRNRITVHASGGVVGFWSADHRTLVDVAHCPLASDEVNERLAVLRERAPESGHYSLRESSLPPAGFHQTNRHLLEGLRDAVVAAFRGASGHLFEGYCGGGFFTVPLSRQFARVTAAEQDGRALRQVPRLEHVDWVQADTGEALGPVQPDHVLVDPPREGLPPAVADLIAAKAPASVVYVSCDPATLARDVARWAGRFRVVSVQPVDLFPQTAHIECVARLERVAS